MFRHKDSLTAQYMLGHMHIPVPERRPRDDTRQIRIVGATENNLKNVSVDIPIGLFTCVTGVSGGGKSTLIIDTLFKHASRRLMGAREHPGAAQVDRGAGAPRQGD